MDDDGRFFLHLLLYNDISELGVVRGGRRYVLSIINDNSAKTAETHYRNTYILIHIFT